MVTTAASVVSRGNATAATVMSNTISTLPRRRAEVGYIYIVFRMLGEHDTVHCLISVV